MEASAALALQSRYASFDAAARLALPEAERHALRLAELSLLAPSLNAACAALDADAVTSAAWRTYLEDSRAKYDERVRALHGLAPDAPVRVPLLKQLEHRKAVLDAFRERHEPTLRAAAAAAAASARPMVLDGTSAP